MIEVAPITESRFTYNDAVLYCFSLNIDGKIGWDYLPQKNFTRYTKRPQNQIRYFAASLRPSDVVSSVDGIDRE